MFVICYLLLAVISAVQMKGINIMLNKPSVQSSTIYKDYPPWRANDGNKSGLPSRTDSQLHPFWQGDLQGFYTVTTVSVSSTDLDGYAHQMRKVIIGVSVHDVGCSEGKVTKCGQWPDAWLTGHTIDFNCSHAGPVRYVRIWTKFQTYLTLGEVEVEGEHSIHTGSGTCCKTRYDKFNQKKVQQPTKSLSATDVTDCSAMCLRNQACVAFSYSQSEQPNCLLTADVTMMKAVMWRSYRVSGYL